MWKQPCDNVVILCMEEIREGIRKLSKLPVNQILLLNLLNISASNQSWGHWQANWNQVANAASFCSGCCHFNSLFLYAAQWYPSRCSVKARGEVITSEGALPFWFVSTSCSSQVVSAQDQSEGISFYCNSCFSSDFMKSDDSAKLRYSHDHYQRCKPPFFVTLFLFLSSVPL